MQPILIDTNLLVYVYDRRDPVRQAAAQSVVRMLVKTGIGRLTAQCLSEFYSAVTRRKQDRDPILSAYDAARETEKLARALATFPVTQAMVLEALRGVRQHGFHFWDAQIWAGARQHHIPTIFSEDRASGALIEGVRYENPLLPGFQIEAWIR
jgi:predicted nucleic acid-binding protein